MNSNEFLRKLTNGLYPQSGSSSQKFNSAFTLRNFILKGLRNQIEFDPTLKNFVEYNKFTIMGDVEIYNEFVFVGDRPAKNGVRIEYDMLYKFQNKLDIFEMDYVPAPFNFKIERNIAIARPISASPKTIKLIESLNRNSKKKLPYKLVIRI